MVTFSYFLMTILGFAGLFLIGLILLQRGRGGGLAGAFGGMGGQSAFGTKAGDVFTRITIGVASAWILLCAGSVLALNYAQYSRFGGPDTVEQQKEPAVDVRKDAREESKPKDADNAVPLKKDEAKDGKVPAEDAKKNDVKPQGEIDGDAKPGDAEAQKPKPE